jgi:molecular chaperone GrpE
MVEQEIKLTDESVVEEVNQPTPEELLAQANDRYLRLFADFENYKKRVQKEKEELKINTKTNMLSSILDLDSDLSIAVKKEPENEGLKIIMSKLDSYLKSQNIQSIQTNTYDENIHEVISVVEIGESKILDVVSKGYMIGGKPFRYPKIILGK